MNPRLQAYLLQCIDHDEMTIDQGDRGDKAIIDNLRRQLAAVTAERDKENRDHVAWVLAKDDQINKLTAERDALREAARRVTDYLTIQYDLVDSSDDKYNKVVLPFFGTEHVFRAYYGKGMTQDNFLARLLALHEILKGES